MSRTPRYIARGLNESRKRETAEFLEVNVKPHPQCKPSRCSGMRIALNGAYAWLYQLLGITLGGVLSIVGGAVAQYMTQGRETTKTRNEFQRNTVVELRNALIMAMESIHEATGSTDPGVITKVIMALQRVNLLQCCLDNETLRKQGHRILSSTCE